MIHPQSCSGQILEISWAYCTKTKHHGSLYFHWYMFNIDGPVSHTQNAQDFVNIRSTHLGSYRRSIKRCIKFWFFYIFHALLKPDQEAVFCCIIFIKPVQVVSVNIYVHLRVRWLYISAFYWSHHQAKH
jgi:hypothetical protein